MSEKIEENKKKIDDIQDSLKKLLRSHAILCNEIGELQEQLQGLQSENYLILEGMKTLGDSDNGRREE
jgi:septal ring factor EnvC (AmiA/AmiB activator)